MIFKASSLLKTVVFLASFLAMLSSCDETENVSKDDSDMGGDADTDSDTDADGDTDSDVDGDIDTDTDTDIDADGDTDTDTDADGDGDSDTDTDADGDTDSDVDGDSDTDTDADGDSDTDTDVDTDTDTDTDGDSDTDTDVDTDTDTDTDSDGDTDGPKYYVDATEGSDSNNGLTPSTAWKTTSKVSSTSFSPGDTILFKRGEIWREEIDIKHSGSSSSPITYGAYGEGAKPLFLGSISLNNTSDWTSLGSNRWASPGSFPSDVGFILFGAEHADNVGIKRSSSQEVDADKEFWYDADNARVVVYCTQNPASTYSSIEASRSTADFNHLIEGPSGISYIHIENLEIKYFNSHAMAFIDSTGIEVRNCDISYGGGAEPSFRYGNGIEFWEDAKDCVVEGCKIGQCYDSGVTLQAQGTQATVSNIYFKNNILWGNDMAAYELAFANSSTTLKNIHFENNVCIGNGLSGWSHKHRTNDCGWDVCTWAGHVGSWDGWYVKNNVYYEGGATWYSASLYYEFNTAPTHFEMDYNYYYKTPDGNSVMIIDHGDRYEMSTFSDYQSATGRDAHSSTGNRSDAQNEARAKVSCEDVFFLNTLFQEADSIVTGNAPTTFDLISPIDEASVGNTVTLTWDSSSGTGSSLDHYEVWIDCSHVADVPAGTTSYTTSSLSNGEHSWFVIAVCQDSDCWRQSSSNFTFNKA